jgi:hypothetical protein
MQSSDPGVALLKKLLALSERSPDRVRPASATPDYDSLLRADAISRFRSQLAAAERSGAVELRYGKRERRHLVERVVVRDSLALARHLGHAPSSVKASEARKKLEAVVVHGDAWSVRVLEEMQNRWARGEQAYRLGVDDVDAAKEFLTLLCAISRNEARGLDARTFALRATGDTKAFDRQSSRLLGVLALLFPDTPEDAIWSRIGLERFPHPVHLRGPLLAQSEQGILVNGNGKPFVSIHPEMLPLLRISTTPSYVLTIENYASFNRHVRELDDSGLTIYTGGFASLGVMALLTWILRNVDHSVPFFHWGDIDPGGLRIFRYLEETLPRAPYPHLMERALAEAWGKPAPPDPSLFSIAESPSAVANLGYWLASGDKICHLEQEALSPATPFTAKVS